MNHAAAPCIQGHAIRRQSGLSLIETMVGITIGLLVVLAATGMLIITRQGTTTVSESYRIASAGNAAMRLIASTIRQAGAVDVVLIVPADNNSPVFFPGDMTVRGAGATANQLVLGTEGAAGAADSLTVSYQHRANNITRDCLGNAPPGGGQVRIDNVFTVNQVELQCVGRLANGANIGAGPQALVGDNTRPNQDVGVQDFQIWYWVSNPADLTQMQRVTATSPLIAASGWGIVEAVEVCLHLRGISTNFPAGNFTNCQGTSVNNAGQLNQVFRGVYKIRNRI